MKKNKSIKINMILNMLKGIMSIIFPLISFPYISKVLGVDNIGKYNFASSIVSYFVLIAGLGITTYAIREGTKYRESISDINIFVNEIFSINIISSLLAYILLVICLISINKLFDYKELIVILSIQIAFQTIGVEWLYSIYEDYLYITVRSFMFQLVSLILMFVLVCDSNSVNLYALITVIASVGSNVMNFVHSKKYSRIKFTCRINWRAHLKPILILFAMSLTVTLYVSSDTTILGLIKGNNSVGIYSISTKIYTVIKRVLSSILVVSIPRLSLYWGMGKQSDFISTAKDIYQTLLTILMPVILGIILLRKEIILIISTESYLQATTSLVLLSFALFFCMGAWFWGQCILIPCKQENIVFKATIVSAIVNIILNIILIPIWAENAAAFTTIVAEGIAFFWCRHYRKKELEIRFSSQILEKIIIGCIVVFITIFCLSFLKLGIYLKFIVSVVTSIILYLLSQIILRNPTVLPILNKVKKQKNISKKENG
jgi:O-antigen/teichoic acid export membrane protein